HRAPPASPRLEVHVGDAGDHEAAARGEVEDLVAPPVNELRAELDGRTPAAGTDRADAAAEPPGRLEEERPRSRARALARGGEAGDARIPAPHGVGATGA